MVTQLIVDVISESSILVQWGPPEYSNGILTHYTVVVFNQLTEFNFTSRVDVLDANVITVTGLSIIFITIIIYTGQTTAFHMSLTK